MRDNSSILFHLKLYMLSTKGTHQVQLFRLSTARMKINRISCHFASHKSVFTWILHHLSVSWHNWNHKGKVYSIASLFSVMKDNSSVFFLSETFILWIKRTRRSENFKLLSGWVKIQQIRLCHVWNYRSVFL